MHQNTNTPNGYGHALYRLIPLLFFLSSCSSVRLIQEYDETTDRKVTQLQEKFARFFVRMQKQMGQADGRFDHYEGFYEDVHTELNVLEVRNRAIPKSELTEEQLGLLEDQVLRLEKLHQLGFTDYRELVPVKSAMESSFAALIKFQIALKNRIKS
jgi:hypothetical protein